MCANNHFFDRVQSPSTKLFPYWQSKCLLGKLFVILTKGKVFKMLYAEPAGQLGSAASMVTYDAQYGEAFHVKPRRFVVVFEGTNSCTCM